MVTRIGLLVHTTAPSSRNDDERYKAQAEAYRSFVAAGTSTMIISYGSANATDGLPLFSPDSIVEANISAEMRLASEKRHDESTELFYDPTTFLEETQLGYTALESQIFPTSSRASKKPFKRALEFEQRIGEDETTRVEELEHHAPRQDGSSSSHRIPSQSSYLMSPVLDRSSKKPRINEVNRQYFQASRPLIPPSILVQEIGEPVVGSTGPASNLWHPALKSRQHSSQLESHSLSGDDVTSELPTSYSLSDMSPGSSRNRQHSIQRSVSDQGPSLAGPAEPELEEQKRSEVPRETLTRHATTQKETEPTPPSRHAQQASSKSTNSETAVKDFAKAGNISERPKDPPANTTDPTIPPTHLDLPTIIRAPAPQPSLQPFETHITESLKYLSSSASLAQSYKPLSVSRDLEQSERGCWTFDITPWPAQLRMEFFQFLAKMIEPGRVGWGVWCVREEASSEDFLRVRVFCWGEVVRHVYLMLYVASKSKVRKLGLRWVDAEGEVVVQMRGEDGYAGRSR